MSLILYSAEDMELGLSHGAILCTKEQADEYYLMHYRTKGSRNGVRRFQDESGTLTPEGYRHYAEMYGWNRRANKAQRLQNRADKASRYAEVASRQHDKDVVKAYNANRKNERRTTDRNQAKADKLNARAEDSNIESTKARLAADKAQDRATRYADKLQRKADKIQSKIDKKFSDAKTPVENGTEFAQELIKKGLAPKGVMNAVSKMETKRLHIDNEFDSDHIRDSLNGAGIPVQKGPDGDSWIAPVKVGPNVEAHVFIKRNDKFGLSVTAYGEEGLIKQGLAKKAIDTVNETLSKDQSKYYANKNIDRNLKRLSELTGGDLDRDRAHLIDRLRSELEDSDGLLSKERAGKAQEVLDNEISREKTALKNLVDGSLNKFDTLSEKEKAKVGDQLLDQLSADQFQYRENDSDYKKATDDMHKWLINKVYEKSGSINAGEYKDGTNAAKAQDQVNDIFKRMNDREEQIKKEIGYVEHQVPILKGRNEIENPVKRAQHEMANRKYQAEQKRLQAALQKDSTWKDLDRDLYTKSNDVIGAILKDLGFSDTPRNRSILYRWGWWD